MQESDYPRTQNPIPEEWDPQNNSSHTSHCHWQSYNACTDFCTWVWKMLFVNSEGHSHCIYMSVSSIHTGSIM